jgi:hypothetical protein
MAPHRRSAAQFNLGLLKCPCSLGDGCGGASSIMIGSLDSSKPLLIM